MNIELKAWCSAFSFIQVEDQYFFFFEDEKKLFEVFSNDEQMPLLNELNYCQFVEYAFPVPETHEEEKQITRSMIEHTAFSEEVLVNGIYLPLDENIRKDLWVDDEF